MAGPSICLDDKKLFFGVVSSSALSYSIFLAIEITSGISRRGESVENGLVNGTGVDSIDSTFGMDLSACFLILWKNYDRIMMRELSDLYMTLLTLEPRGRGGDSVEQRLSVPFDSQTAICGPGGRFTRRGRSRCYPRHTLHSLVWRKRGLEVTGTLASAKGVIEMLRLSGRLGRRWMRVRVVMVVVRMTVMMKRRLLVCRVGGFGVDDGAGVVVDGGGLRPEV